MSAVSPTLHVERLDLKFAPKPWPFAAERRAEIDAHFEAMRREKPELWNGQVLLLHDHAIEGSVFRGAYLQTDFASFCAWRHWDADARIRNCFAAAAILSADGAFLLGVMGLHTANAGRIYFPCGTPDPSDLAGDRVDLESSVRRELKEETGLNAGEFSVEAGWWTVSAGLLIAQIKLLRSRQTAGELRARILTHLSSERQPELSDIRIVRGPADFDPMMPDFVVSFLQDFWSRNR